MALLPAESQRISYVPEELLKLLPTYEINEECAHPECDVPAFEKHHIVRRSYTQGKGAQTWMAIDGTPVPNLVGLCRAHHAELENNESRIEYKDGHFFWHEKTQGGFTAPLFPLPLTETAEPPLSPVEELTATADTAEDSRLGERDEEEDGQSRDGRERSSRSLASEEGSPAAQAAPYELSGAPSSEKPSALSEGEGIDLADGPVSGEDPPRRATSSSESAVCSGCGRKLPKPKEEQDATRPKATWSIKVPVDERENGYALLRDLVEQCQHELGRENEPPYYALIQILYFFLTTPKEKAA